MSVVIRPWVCPVCEGTPDGHCLFCTSTGFAEDVAGWEPQEVTAAPRPPGVMGAPCGDCAFRFGSPEQEKDYELNGLAQKDNPFVCHRGMPVVDGKYTPVAECDGRPLGYLVCAGWWEWVTRGQLPARAYREPRDT